MQSVNRSRHHVVVVGGRVAGQANVRYGWPLQVIENAGHLAVAERPDALPATLGHH